MTTTPETVSPSSYARSVGARTATAMAVAALALTGCSSGGGDQPDPEASYSQDQLVNALNIVEVDGQKLSAKAMDEQSAGAQMNDLEQVLEQSTIKPPQCKDLIKAALDTSSGHAEDIVVATPARGKFAVSAMPLDSADEAAKHAETANQQNEDCRDFTMELMGNKIEANIEPQDLTVDKANHGTVMEMTMNMSGHANKMTQASAVVGNTFVVVSGQAAPGESESAAAQTPQVKEILQESVNKISEQ